MKNAKTLEEVNALEEMLKEGKFDQFVVNNKQQQDSKKSDEEKIQ